MGFHHNDLVGRLGENQAEVNASSVAYESRIKGAGKKII